MKSATLETVLRSEGVLAFGWVLLVFLPAIMSVRIFKKARTDLHNHGKVTWRRTFWFPTLSACVLASVCWVFAISSGFSIA